MRFMLMLKGDPPPGAMPPPELVQAMHEYDVELEKAGVLLAAEGLWDSSKGARVIYAKGARTVVDGPFTEAKELIAGFYLIDVKSLDEAIEWARRCPVDRAIPPGADWEAVVEVRQVAEPVEITTINEEQAAQAEKFHLGR
ncbi:YciI family protein [Asanoa sp. WMMD1127]|uniref:YciI family protein n=1 Tax=Asanoa sp. WMMD1127 TaxID=3016107 RepID=UPI002416BFBB|nr:YciI family protein [Asanoa sp. WMMD1127]MDG4823147.1 YciI family protein [Asanoa sp. WMMD1127]